MAKSPSSSALRILNIGTTGALTKAKRVAKEVDMKTQILALIGLAMIAFPTPAFANPALSAFCADPVNAKSPLCGSIDDMDKDIDELARRFRAIPPKVIFIKDADKTVRIDTLYKLLESYLVEKQGDAAKVRLARLVGHEDTSFLAKVLSEDFDLDHQQARLAAKIVRMKGKGRDIFLKRPVQKQVPAKETGTLI